MTAIIAYAPNSKSIYMAADKRVSMAYNRFADTSLKIIKGDNFLLGSSGDHRLANILNGVDWKKRWKVVSVTDGGDYDSAIAHLADIFRHEAAAQQYSIKREEQVSLCNCSILVGLPGAIYEVAWDFSYVPIGHRYWSIGSGAGLVLGSFHARLMRGIDGEDSRAAIVSNLMFAIEDASRFDSSVSRTCDVLDIRNEQEKS